MLDEAFKNFSERFTATIEQMVTIRLQRVLDKFCRSTVKVIYTEEEAAAFLGVGAETLQAWRQRNLIDYAQYPVGRLRDGQEDGLGRTYTYDVAQLLSFREQYIVKAPAPAKYKLNSVVSLLGPEISANGGKS